MSDRAMSARLSAAGLVSILLGLSACGPVPEQEEIELKTQAVVIPSTLNVGRTDQSRAIDRRCTLYTCKRWERLATVLRCAEYYPTCADQVWSDVLKNSSGIQFPPYSHPDETWQYRGCGASAAQNVLAWFGVNWSLEYVASQMLNIDWPGSSQIGMAPDTLVLSLQALLNQNGVGKFTVRRNRGTYLDVAAAISRTKNPVIVLVNSGNHYVTATGWKASTLTDWAGRAYANKPYYFQVIDYPDNGSYERMGPDLRMEFDTWSWAGLLQFTSPGILGYLPGTYLTIERSGDFLEPGQRLYPNRTINSPDGRFKLQFMNNGDLILYRWDGAALWSSDTWGYGAAYAEMQTDGNLVVYDPYRNALWASGTHGWNGAHLRLQDDGNLVIYWNETAPWHSGTYGY